MSKFLLPIVIGSAAIVVVVAVVLMTGMQDGPVDPDDPVDFNEKLNSAYGEGTTLVFSIHENQAYRQRDAQVKYVVTKSSDVLMEAVGTYSDGTYDWTNNISIVKDSDSGYSASINEISLFHVSKKGDNWEFSDDYEDSFEYCQTVTDVRTLLFQLCMKLLNNGACSNPGRAFCPGVTDSDNSYYQWPLLNDLVSMRAHNAFSSDDAKDYFGNYWDYDLNLHTKMSDDKAELVDLLDDYMTGSVLEKKNLILTGHTFETIFTETEGKVTDRGYSLGISTYYLESGTLMIYYQIVDPRYQQVTVEFQLEKIDLK